MKLSLKYFVNLKSQLRLFSIDILTFILLYMLISTGKPESDGAAEIDLCGILQQ